MRCTSSSVKDGKSTERLMRRCTSARSVKTSTNWSKTDWNDARPAALNAIRATTLTRLSPQGVGESLTDEDEMAKLIDAGSAEEICALLEEVNAE